MRKASLLTIFLIVFIDLVGFGILLPNQQYYGELLGIRNPFLLTLIGPAYSFFQFIFAPILGRWSDRVGRRPVLLFSQVGTFLSYILLFYCPLVADEHREIGVFLLYFSRILAGAAGGNISIATAYVADITKPEDRAKGMGLIGAAFGIGFICGPIIGGVVGGYLGLQFVPIGAASFSLAAIFRTYFTLGESHHPGDRTEGLRRFSIQGLRHAMARPIIGALIWMFFVNGFAFAGMEQTFSLIIQQRAYPVSTAPIVRRANARGRYEASGDRPRTLDEAAMRASKSSGLLFGSIGIIMAVMQGTLTSRLTRTFGEPALATWGPIIIAVGLIMVGGAGTFLPGVWTWFWIGAACLAIGSSLFNPTVQSLISRHAQAQEQGEILGAAQGMASLARALGPLLAGVLFWQISSGMPYYVSAGICAVVAVWTLAMGRRLRPPAVSET